jgi:hypothetical protein
MLEAVRTTARIYCLATAEALQPFDKRTCPNGNNQRTTELVDRLLINTERRHYQPLGTMRVMILMCRITRLIIPSVRIRGNAALPRYPDPCLRAARYMQVSRCQTAPSRAVVFTYIPSVWGEFAPATHTLCAFARRNGDNHFHCKFLVCANILKFHSSFAGYSGDSTRSGTSRHDPTMLDSSECRAALVDPTRLSRMGRNGLCVWMVFLLYESTLHPD